MAGNVVSATVGAIKRQDPSAVFMAKAHGLLLAAEKAYQDGRYSDALEQGYQAALRIAGSRISPLSQRKRKRAGVSVWEKLASVDEAGEAQAQIFEPYSAVRSRVLNGLDKDISPICVRRLLAHVSEFIDFAERERGWLSPAA